MRPRRWRGGHQILRNRSQDNQTQVEVIFNGYFAEERAPNDRDLLVKACVAAGKSEADARAFLDDKSAMRDQVQRELSEARGVRGVPHFVIRQPGRDPVQISGAQPPDVFERALQ